MNAYETQDYTLVRSLNCKMSAAMDRVRNLEAWRAVLRGELTVEQFDAAQRVMVRFEARKMEAA